MVARSERMASTTTISMREFPLDPRILGNPTLPMKSLTAHFDPKDVWRANFFRIEGEKEPRFYSAWSPTHSPRPNFHVASAFGTLTFRE